MALAPRCSRWLAKENRKRGPRTRLFILHQVEANELNSSSVQPRFHRSFSAGQSCCVSPRQSPRHLKFAPLLIDITSIRNPILGKGEKGDLLEAKARRTDRPVFHLSWRKQSLRQLMDMFRLIFRHPMFHLTDLGCGAFTSSETFFVVLFCSDCHRTSPLPPLLAIVPTRRLNSAFNPRNLSKSQSPDQPQS